MKNEQVIENYFRGINCHSLNVYSSGDNLINYNTILVHKEDDIYYVNIKYYSHTTSKIQSYIKGELRYITNKIIYYYGDKYGDNYKYEYYQVKFIGTYGITNNSGIGITKIDEDEIEFYYCYDNLISDAITRKIQYDKNGEPYFRYNNKIYLNEIVRTML